MASGCGGPPKARTTFLNSVDLINMTDQMAGSLAQHPVICARTMNDTPWIISINRVSNQTNQIIPEREKWLYIARLRTVLAQSSIGKERQLIWVMPPEQWAAVQDELADPGEPIELRMKPTHQLTADFYTLTNTSGAGRSDMYHCAYVLLDLTSGEELWRASWEVKRASEGKTYD